MTPLIGFYLQPSVGGRVLPYSFWRQFVEIENVVAIKFAPFNRYQTLDVMRAVAGPAAATSRSIPETTTTSSATSLPRTASRSTASASSGEWSAGSWGTGAVWTHEAVRLLERCHKATADGGSVSTELLRISSAVTDLNAAFFDAANGFAGCIAGLHEVLRRQGLLEGIWCLDPEETLSPGQRAEIDRVYRAYPSLNDDAFVQANRDDWLRG